MIPNNDEIVASMVLFTKSWMRPLKMKLPTNYIDLSFVDSFHVSHYLRNNQHGLLPEKFGSMSKEELPLSIDIVWGGRLYGRKSHYCKFDFSRHWWYSFMTVSRNNCKDNREGGIRKVDQERFHSFPSLKPNWQHGKSPWMGGAQTNEESNNDVSKPGTSTRYWRTASNKPWLKHPQSSKTVSISSRELRRSTSEHEESINCLNIIRCP